MKVERTKGEKTRQEILEAAASVFIAKGYEGASISDIASQKEVNQSLIYHYFKDKKALWSSVKDWVFADFQVLRKGESVDSLVRQFAYLAEHPDVLRLILWQQLEEKMEMATATPKVPPGQDPELFATFLSSLLYGPFQKACTIYPVKLPEYADVLAARLKRLYLP